MIVDEMRVHDDGLIDEAEIARAMGLAPILCEICGRELHKKASGQGGTPEDHDPAGYAVVPINKFGSPVELGPTRTLPRVKVCSITCLRRVRGGALWNPYW